MATAAEIYAGAIIWDDHAGFECRPDANLRQLAQWRDAGVTYLSVNVGYDVRPWVNTVKTLASFRRQLAQSDDCVLVAGVDDIHEAKRQGKLAVTFDIEGMESLDGDADMVAVYYHLGVRHMLFAYNLNNRAGGGCHDEDIGLTDFGREVIMRMNQAGMVVDCSHSAYRTTMEAMEASTQPVIFSHSNPRALVDHPRNITDDQIKACAAGGGVIGINGVSLFLDDDGVTPETFADHVIYIAELVGSDYVGMGYRFRGAIIAKPGLLAFGQRLRTQSRLHGARYLAPHNRIAAVSGFVRSRSQGRSRREFPFGCPARVEIGSNMEPPNWVRLFSR